MATLIALLTLVALVLVVAGSRGPRATPRARKGPPPRRTPAPPQTREADVIGGWLLGHQIVHGRDGFPGDPLPHGHLGSPADLAFWGTVFDEEDEE